MAYKLWRDFSANYPEPLGTAPVFRVGELHRRAGVGINKVAFEFYEYCARMSLGVARADVGYCDLLGVAPDQRGTRAASWLWKTGVKVPMIAIDKEYVTALVPRDDQRDKIFTRLLLHEVGHVVFHWKDLRPGIPRGDAAPLLGATVEQEEEAWWFASSIVGLAVGDQARRLRAGGANDAAWPEI
jgi:hypothetical protein